VRLNRLTRVAGVGGLEEDVKRVGAKISTNHCEESKGSTSSWGGGSLKCKPMRKGKALGGVAWVIARLDPMNPK